MIQNIEQNINILSDPVVKVFRELALKSSFSLYSIYLFGSRAKEEAKIDSDYDFLIILKETPEGNAYKRLKFEFIVKIHDLCPDTDFDILFRTLQEFDLYKNELNTIYNQIYEEGILIYEDKCS